VLHPVRMVVASLKLDGTADGTAVSKYIKIKGKGAYSSS